MPLVKRGRPLKFGRPSRVSTLSLPEDAWAALRRVHRDPAWAILALLERSGTGPQPVESPRDVELTAIGPRHSLIVVNRHAFAGVPGADLVPLSDTLAFLALKQGASIADLELALTDRLEQGGPDADYDRLKALLGEIRQWRRSGELTFHYRSIIVVERKRVRRRRPTRSRAAG